MEIRELKEDEASKWDNLAKNSEESWLFHLYDWGRIMREVYGTKNIYIVVEEKNEFLAILPISIGKRHIFKWADSAGTGYGGIAFNRALSAKEKNGLACKIFSYVNALAEKEKLDWFKIRLPPLAEAYLPDKTSLSNPLVQYGFGDVASYHFMLDLAPAQNVLWSQMDRKTRNMVRKAEKNNVHILEVQPKNNIDKYYQLHLETCKRTSAKSFPKKYYARIFEYFGGKGVQRLFFAKLEGEVIAALSIGAFQKGIHYWSGAASTEHMGLGANDLLQWHAINWAKENGFAWYDNGDVIPWSKNRKLRGLYQFKGSFGGTLTRTYNGLMTYSRHKRILAKLAIDLLRGGVEL